MWDGDLLILNQKGWKIDFDPITYLLEIQPIGFGRSESYRARGFFEQIIAGFISISLEDILLNEIEIKAIAIPSKTAFPPKLNGEKVKQLRISVGISQMQLSRMTKISQGLIFLIEKGERKITAGNAELLNKSLKPNN